MVLAKVKYHVGKFPAASRGYGWALGIAEVSGPRQFGTAITAFG
jgi:hypothetical protein